MGISTWISSGGADGGGTAKGGWDGSGAIAGLELSAGSAALLVLDLCRKACEKGREEIVSKSSVVRRLERVWKIDEQGRWPGPKELAIRVGLQRTI